MYGGSSQAGHGDGGLSLEEITEIRDRFAVLFKKDPSAHVMVRIQRTHQWAASGRRPSGMSHDLLRVLRDTAAAEARRRNPYSAAGSVLFPPAPDGTGGSDDEAVPGRWVPARSWAWPHAGASPWDPGGWDEDEQRLFDGHWEEHGDDRVLAGLIGSYGAMWPWPAAGRVAARLPDLVSLLRRLTGEKRLARGYGYTSELPGRAADYALTHGLAGRMRRRHTWPDPQPLQCPQCCTWFGPAALEPWAIIQFGPPRWCRACCWRARGGMPGKPEPGHAADALRAIADVTGAPPRGDFATQPVPLDWPAERRDTLLTALCACPPAAAIRAAFGTRSWRQVLAETGLLDSSHRQARGTMCVASDGHPCRSLGERSVDDWLTAHGVAHQIEPPWPHHGTLNPRTRLRGDWRLADGTYVEYAGMLADDDYAARIGAKRALAAECGIKLIVLVPEDLIDLTSALPPATAGPPKHSAERQEFL